uniref:Serpin domain-containing protein n=1 Tax=Callithrix jacchus TaxID=9483 RepID=A0A8I4A2P3_CALJA
MDTPQWWPVVTVLTAGAHFAALVDQEASHLIHFGPKESSPGPALPQISVSNIDFAFNLRRQLALNNRGGNILFSSASISLALAMLSLGAPVASRTQLLEGLGFNLTVVSEAEIQEGFWDLLLRLLGQGPQLLLTTAQCGFSGLGSGTNQSLEEAPKHIDEYIEKQTQGKLGAWEKDLGSEMAAVPVNPILLRAEWTKPFDSAATSPKEVFVHKHRTVWVSMMKEKASHHFLHDPELWGSVLQMDHAGNTTTFFIFPNRGKRTRFPLPQVFHFQNLQTGGGATRVTVGGGFPGQLD